VPDPQNAFGMSFSPAAATFNGKMYIFGIMHFANPVENFRKGA
jgi:hypothetical protein